LIFDVNLVLEDACTDFILQSDQPRINTAFLADRSLLTSVEQRKQIAETLLHNWNEQQSREENLKKILNAFYELLPQEIFFSPKILSGSTTEITADNGILSLGIIFKNVSSPYTAGLEKELRDLQNIGSPNEILRVFLERNAVIKNDSDEELLEITGLNDEQRSAVRSAFNNTVTVVTGPPGTGKSQVVLNIIANALLRNQSVLFSSKNHQAIDVVIERLSQLQSEPLVLRYGQKEREIEFAENLLSAIERATNYDDKLLQLEIESLRQESTIIRNEEKEAKQILFRILEGRNRINCLDAEFKNLATELPRIISDNLKSTQQIKIRSKLPRKLRLLDRLIKETENGASLKSYLLSLFGFSLEKRILKITKSLPDLVEINGFKSSTNSISDCRELLKIAKILQKWSDHQSEIFLIAQENENNPKIETLRDRIFHSKERLIRVSIKYVDALMKYRLKSLSPNQRRDIADYVNIVRTLNSNRVSGESADRLRAGKARAFKSVVKAFPAMAVTNLSIRHAFPLAADIVDIVIIDEASQCDIASALPLLYRSKRAVIVGDPHQLSHISLLRHEEDHRLIQSQIGFTSTDDQRFLYSINSLFELARSTIGSGSKFIHLLEHYRSREEIIGFSSKKFYGGNLRVWTDYKKLRSSEDKNSVVWHDVSGNVIRPSAGSAYNLSEAQAVVALIKNFIIKNPAYGTQSISLGVVTPFREQANKIRHLAESTIDKVQLQKLNLVVDTAHKYQGDEKDVMIFSPVISNHMQQGSINFLGNSSNLFNVAITRARSELHIVGDKLACANSGISYLSDFVNHVEAIERKNNDTNSGMFESPWEEILYNALAKEGIRAIAQYSIYQYRLDLAVLDLKTPLNIEIDGEMWHRDIDGGRLLYDLKRDQYLISHGWQVKRFWAYQLKHNLEKCVNEIKAEIENLKL
jgi:very-short-patch-repair endonuclease